jgi:hypothetical protein
MAPTDENATPPRPHRRAVIVTLLLLGAGLLLAARFHAMGHGFSAALPWSHHFSVHSPRARGDLLLAIQSLEINGAQLRLKPGRYQVKSSGHTIEVRPETDLTIDINKLVLHIPQPAPASGDNPAASNSNSRVRVEVQSADFKTTGRLMVAVDQLPAVRLNDLRVNAAPTDPANVSADVLFARLIASTLTDVVDAPLAMSEPVQRDFHPESVSVTAATLLLRPGASIHLPGSREMVLGDASQIRIRDLHYDAGQGQSWKAKVDLDIGFAPPTEFAANKLTIKPGAARFTLALDVALSKEELSAALIATPAKPAKLTLAGGSIGEQPQVWEAELTHADISIDSLNYTASLRGDHAAFNCVATLTAASQIRWDRNGWHGSANLLINKLKLMVPSGTSGTKTPALSLASADEHTTLQNLVLERDVGGGTIGLFLGELTVSGSVGNALSLNAALARFNGSGGQFSYKGRDGTLITADFGAGGSFASNISPPGQTVKPGPVEFALKGKATAVDISTPKNEKLHLQNVDLDLKSVLGSSPGLSLSCSGDIAVLSDRLALAGAHASITSLELQQGSQGKLLGHVGLALSVPKSELIDAAQKELAKPIIIPGKHLGKVLDADVSVSDLNVDSHSLKVAFSGPKLHVEGPISTSGKLITKRRIVVDIPLAGRIEKHTSNHDDFTLHAHLSANATAAFPSAPDLATQALEIHFEYQKANLELGSILGKLPLANEAFKDLLKVFGIESKIKSALPGKTTVHLFKPVKGDSKSILTRIRNPQIILSDVGDQLVVSGNADIEY